MLSDYTIQQIKGSIYSFPELWGCVILYIGKSSSQVVSGGYMATNNYYTIIVIEELNKENDQPPRPQVKYNQEFQGNELKGGVINCSFFAIAAITTLGGAASEPLTLGASSAVVVAGYMGMAATGAQCLNSIVRTRIAYSDQLGTTLQSWDSNGWYSGIMTSIDIVGIATGVVGLAAAANEIKTFLRVRNLLASDDALARMTRAERIAAYEKALKDTSKDERVAKEFEKILAKYPAGQRMLNGSPSIIRNNVRPLSRFISDATLERMAANVRDIIVNATNLGLNGAPASFSGTASGQLNNLGNFVMHVIN